MRIVSTSMPVVMLAHLTVLIALAGCAANPVPRQALRLEESALDIRAMQTRTFVAPSESVIMSATIATLQDLEFNIDRIDRRLGVVTASKVADADSTGEKIGLWALAILCGCGDPQTAKDEQHVTATLVVLPSLARGDEYIARITLQRAVFDKAERVSSLEQIDDPIIYQQIFDRLSTSIFMQVSRND